MEFFIDVDIISAVPFLLEPRSFFHFCIKISNSAAVLEKQKERYTIVQGRKQLPLCNHFMTK